MRIRGFINGAYSLPSLALECQRAVNMFPEINEAKTAPNSEIGHLIKVYGNRPYLTLPKTPVRGLYTSSKAVLYGVGGDHLYEIKSTNEIVDRGELLTSTSRVSMIDNGFQLGIVDGTYGYSYALTGASPVAKITSGAFYSGDSIDFMDTQVIVPRKGTMEYHWSGLNDVTSWNALDYAVAMKSPDPLITARVFGSQVWVLGPGSTEVHQNTGRTFEPIQGAHFAIGCASAACVQVMEESLIWLDASAEGYGTVWRAQGLSPERISTHAIEKALQAKSDLSGAFAWSYKEGGHAFYCLTLPYDTSTWCYDLSTGQWHERVSVDTHNREKVSRIGCHAFAYNRHFCGDSTTGDIYVMDPAYQFDGTTPLLWKRTSPHINQNNEPIVISEFALDIETGVGLDGAGQGSDPVVFLRYSKDRGRNWTPPIPASMGKRGEYRTRVVWRRLGMSRDWVFEVSGSDPVPINILGAEIR